MRAFPFVLASSAGYGYNDYRIAKTIVLNRFRCQTDRLAANDLWIICAMIIAMNIWQNSAAVLLQPQSGSAQRLTVLRHQMIIIMDKMTVLENTA